MMQRVAVLCGFLLFGCFFGTIHGNLRLNYLVTEEQRARTFIGNVATDSKLRANLTTEEFNSLRFSLLPQRNPNVKLFSVNERTGILGTADKLDREIICGQNPICMVNLSIGALSTVTDFFSILNVSVSILDINDNSPEFPNPNMQVTFSESAKVGDSFQIQQAVDQDIGINAELSYELQGSDGTFRLVYDKTTSGSSNLRVVVNRLLDHERSQQQQMTLVARDKGSPSKIATATITISISDINDHHPVFTDAVYDLRVLETTPVQTPLLQVSAQDLDQGINGQVTYYFPTLTPQTTKDIFFLNSSTGDLVLQQPLDFENTELYEFQVEAKDGGSPPRVAQTTVKVQVLDVNDNTPAITFNLPPGRQRIAVSETLVPGDFITRMSVFDGDTGRDGEVICKLAGNRFQLTHIFGSEFKILLNSSLDRESEPLVNLTVSCSDRGSPPKQDVQVLTIQIEDSNDNIPKFSQQFYHTETRENPQNGDVIIKVSATDLDIGENGRVTYKINATGAQFFQVLSNGDVIVSSKLDRELTPEVVFDIIAMDNAAPFHSSTATVSITVLDENDEAPNFGVSSLELSVLEKQSEGAVVGHLTATDRDLGLGGEVMYSISPDNKAPFLIQPTNGTIITSSTLDRELVESYQLKILATDKGTPQQTGSLVLTVKVADVNDNTPVFVFPNEHNNTVTIYNSLKVGKVVTNIRASDADDRNNSRVKYAFESDTVSTSFFHVDHSSGIITLAKPLTQQGKRTLEVVVIATDHGDPALSAKMRLFIIVHLDDRPLPMLDGLAGRTNLTIAICILAVSAIVSGTIVIIICLVRRRKNKNTDDSGEKEDKSQTPAGEKTWNSMYDSKKTSSADIIINRDRAPQNLQSAPTQVGRDDRLLYKAKDPTNPTFQVFPAEEHHTPKVTFILLFLHCSHNQH
ncbi:protocadherin gamma-A4-like [Liolophura sinensis]|uniref:protocadherin gamma-A4-like n=1 Tax=Liolophura sinensis TaxID=3198878 RepID=UPI0031581354